MHWNCGSLLLGEGFVEDPAGGEAGEVGAVAHDEGGLDHLVEWRVGVAGEDVVEPRGCCAAGGRDAGVFCGDFDVAREVEGFHFGGEDGVAEVQDVEEGHQGAAGVIGEGEEFGGFGAWGAGEGGCCGEKVFEDWGGEAEDFCGYSHAESGIGISMGMAVKLFVCNLRCRPCSDSTHHDNRISFVTGGNDLRREVPACSECWGDWSHWCWDVRLRPLSLQSSGGGGVVFHCC